MATHEIKNEVQLGAQGRVVIPVHLRKSMDLKPGATDLSLVRTVTASCWKDVRIW
ncbi:MAG: hypothetical protein WBN00_01125 [Sedimenticolaceae bacterium]|jgi:bifunctional DNA-binding transcriptional regulator/antitoxin component of YhaV-PrlF toxin-antitoxin module